MTIKRIIRPDRLRQVPRQFNWIDHRLVRDRHICRCGPQEWALYLFLVTVSDYQGLSYYSDRSIQKLLTMDQAVLELVRQNLVQADLIAFEAPLYQVLSLEAKANSTPTPRAIKRRETVQIHHGPESLGEILRRLQEES